MNVERIPPDLARRLELPTTLPVLTAAAWLPGPTASPAARAELATHLDHLAAGSATTPTRYLEVLGARARRMIAADLLPHLHHGPNRHALEDIDRLLADRGGRLLIALVGVNP